MEESNEILDTGAGYKYIWNGEPLSYEVIERELIEMFYGKNKTEDRGVKIIIYNEEAFTAFNEALVKECKKYLKKYKNYERFNKKERKKRANGK